MATPQELTQQIAQQRQQFAQQEQQLQSLNPVQQTQQQLLSATPMSQVQTQQKNIEQELAKTQSLAQLQQARQEFEAQAQPIESQIASAQQRQDEYRQAINLINKYGEDTMQRVDAKSPLGHLVKDILDSTSEQRLESERIQSVINNPSQQAPLEGLSQGVVEQLGLLPGIPAKNAEFKALGEEVAKRGYSWIPSETYTAGTTASDWAKAISGEVQGPVAGQIVLSKAEVDKAAKIESQANTFGENIRTTIGLPLYLASSIGTNKEERSNLGKYVFESRDFKPMQFVEEGSSAIAKQAITHPYKTAGAVAGFAALSWALPAFAGLGAGATFLAEGIGYTAPLFWGASVVQRIQKASAFSKASVTGEIIGSEVLPAILGGGLKSSLFDIRYRPIKVGEFKPKTDYYNKPVGQNIAQPSQDTIIGKDGNFQIMRKTNVEAKFEQLTSGRAVIGERPFSKLFNLKPAYIGKGLKVEYNPFGLGQRTAGYTQKAYDKALKDVVSRMGFEEPKARQFLKSYYPKDIIYTGYGTALVSTPPERFMLQAKQSRIPIVRELTLEEGKRGWSIFGETRTAPTIKMKTMGGKVRKYILNEKGILRSTKPAEGFELGKPGEVSIFDVAGSTRDLSKPLGKQISRFESVTGIRLDVSAPAESSAILSKAPYEKGLFYKPKGVSFEKYSQLDFARDITYPKLRATGKSPRDILLKNIESTGGITKPFEDKNFYYTESSQKFKPLPKNIEKSTADVFVISTPPLRTRELNLVEGTVTTRTPFTEPSVVELPVRLKAADFIVKSSKKKSSDAFFKKLYEPPKPKQESFSQQSVPKELPSKSGQQLVQEGTGIQRMLGGQGLTEAQLRKSMGGASSAFQDSFVNVVSKERIIPEFKTPLTRTNQLFITLSPQVSQMQMGQLKVSALEQTKLNQKLNLDLNQRLNLNMKMDERLNMKLDQRLNLNLAEKLNQKLEQRMNQRTSQRMTTRTTQRMEERIVPFKPTKEFPPTIPTNDLRKRPQRISKEVSGLFTPEVRRRGKFMSIGTARTPQEAIAKAEAAVKQTLGASFRIKGPKGKLLPLAPKQGFRFGGGKKVQPFVLVQKAPTRIKSFGEIREIKASRRGKGFRL